jgi:hypothetical protein
MQIKFAHTGPGIRFRNRSVSSRALRSYGLALNAITPTGDLVLRFGGVKSRLRDFGFGHTLIEHLLAHVPLLDKLLAPSSLLA